MQPKEELLTKYLHTECLRPRRVTNPYTTDILFTPCGCCAACVANKANVATAYVQNMASHFKFCYFVTLTYADTFLPMVDVCAVERTGNRYLEYADTLLPSSDPRDLKEEWYHDRDLSLDPNENLVRQQYEIGFKYVPRKVSVKVKNSTVYRSFDDVPFEFSVPMTDAVIKDILRRANGKYSYSLRKVVYPPASEWKLQIPVIRNRDFELFMKRLRSNLKQACLPYEEIRYYCVSEYGPQTLRPHWHLLLFFDSPQLTQALRENVCKAWSYGNCDVSLSRGAAASYVASYVNSVASLPYLYTGHKEIRPRCFHSKGFGQNKIFRQSACISEIQEISANCLDGVDCSFNGKIVRLRPSRAYQHTVFPRFSSTFRSDTRDAVQLFFAALTAPERLVHNGYLSISTPSFGDPDFSVTDLVRAYSEYYYDKFTDFSVGWRMHKGYRASNYMDELIFRECRLFDGICISKNEVFGKLYRFFAKVKRTFRFWRLSEICDADQLRRTVSILFQESYEYWKVREYRFLVQYYEYLEGCTNDERIFLLTRTIGTDFDKEVKYMPDDIKESYHRVLSTLTARAKTVCRDKIKHKEYNDMQGVLLFN